MMKGYQAEPRAASKPLGSVLVIHENRGLNAHIEDVARRVAIAGYRALARRFPVARRRNARRPGRGARGDRQARPRSVRRRRGRYAQPAQKPARRQRQSGRGRLLLGRRDGQPDRGRRRPLARRRSAVLRPSPRSVARAPGRGGDAAPLCRPGRTGERDRPALGRGASRRRQERRSRHVYPGVNHAFHNDTSAERYNADAAKLAWERTLAFFATDHRLGSPRLVIARSEATRQSSGPRRPLWIASLRSQ